jgi:hypothetical protein
LLLEHLEFRHRVAVAVAADLHLHLHLAVAATATTGRGVVPAGGGILGPAAVPVWGAADQCACRYAEAELAMAAVHVAELRNSCAADLRSGLGYAPTGVALVGFRGVERQGSG